MADIDVVPRRRSHVWLWVVLAVIVLAVLWWAFAGRHGATATSALHATPSHVAQLATPSAVSIT